MIAASDRAKLVGRNIAIARKLAGMSQKQLAQIVGVPSSYVSDWEHGKHEPRARNFGLLVEALDQHWSWYYRDHSEDDDDEPDEQAA